MHVSLNKSFALKGLNPSIQYKKIDDASGMSASITIAPGAVSATLSSFPLRIYLDDMSTEFWDNITADGGNIRATKTNNSPLPCDIIWVDSDIRSGVIYVLTDISTSGTTIKIKYGNLELTMPAVDSTFGRNAVWANYTSAIIAPDLVDRTGSGTILYGGTTDIAVQRLGFKSKIDLPDNVHQGIATDGTYYYAVDTNTIIKYDLSWTEIARNSDPTTDAENATGEITLAHCGDPTIIGGELYIPIENYPAATYDKQYIVVFNVSDLSLNRYYNISAQLRETSSLCEASDGNIYVTDFDDGSSIPYYNSSFVYQGTLVLSETINKIQGITSLNGRLYVTCDDTLKGIYEIELDGTVNGVAWDQRISTGNLEGITSYGGEIYYITDSAGTTTMWNLSPSAKYGGNNIYANKSVMRIEDIPASTTWTSSVFVTPTYLTFQSGLGSLVRQGSETTRASLVMDTSPSNFLMWNNSDSWAASSPVINPTELENYHAVFKHEGSTARTLYINGTKTVTDSPIVAKPIATGSMVWYIGGEDGSPAEYFYGTLQTATLNPVGASDAWVAAESENLNDSDNFYSVV